MGGWGEGVRIYNPLPANCHSTKNHQPKIHTIPTRHTNHPTTHPITPKKHTTYGRQQAERQAVNGVIQGTASDVMKAAMIWCVSCLLSLSYSLSFIFWGDKCICICVSSLSLILSLLFFESIYIYVCVRVCVSHPSVPVRSIRTLTHHHHPKPSVQRAIDLTWSNNQQPPPPPQPQQQQGQQGQIPIPPLLSRPTLVMQIHDVS